MIIDLELQRDDKGFLTADRALAKDGVEPYNPSKEVKDVTNLVMSDYTDANVIRNTPYEEFNDLDLITRQNTDQRSFNAWREFPSNDPDEAWKSDAFRPIVRNKIISIAAHITGNLIFPRVTAQNDEDEEDKDAATVMSDLMEWTAEQSNYERTFLYSVIGALVNPATIIHQEFRKNFRTIKTKKVGDTWQTKKVLDEENSGFVQTIVPVDELWISNIYEHDIQKQPFLIWRRVLDYNTARDKYKGNENFDKFVTPGIQFLFAKEKDTFYQMYDDNLEDRLVEEIIYYNRSSDLQLTFVNGVLLSDTEQPNPRVDKKYPFAKSGFELIDEGKFFFFKSLSFKTSPDEEVVNELYRLIIDGTFMQLMPPIAVFGEDEIGAAVTIPGRVTTLPNSTKIEKISVGNDLQAGRQTLEKAESSISESATEPLISGQSTPGEQTAFEISRLETNARVLLGLFGKMIGFLVKDLGELVMGDILQHMTVGDVMEIVGGKTRFKFRNFLIPDRTVEGKTKTRKIEFDSNIPEKMTKQEEVKESFNILEREGGLDSNKELLRVNPKAFKNLKFKVKVTPDVVTPPSKNVERALNLEEYDRAIVQPFADQQELYKVLLLGSYDKTRDNPDRFIREKGNELANVVGAETSKAPLEVNKTLAKKEIG